jgi:Secretion system C-terminal sorting domain
MKFKKTILSFAVILLGLGSINAQETTITAGGDISANSGKISYSVGQIFYTSDTGSNGTVLKGIQQPYEIFITLGSEDSNINLKIYPNPTSNLFSLSIESSNFVGMSYQLIDMNGRQLEEKSITSLLTSIQLEQYPSSVYFLKVMRNQKHIKIFKIIKN